MSALPKFFTLGSLVSADGDRQTEFKEVKGPMEGRGAHPIFHLHDGPREADMDASIYRNIFSTIHALEEAFGQRAPTFQYIVTTIEPPPDNLLQPPWLIEPMLDASAQQGKLLGENF